MEAAGRAGFDTGRLEPRAYSIRAQRALVNFLGLRIESRNVERTSSDAILAADAILLLEVHDAVRILNDRSIGRTRAETAGVGAVQAAVLAHQPLERAVIGDMLVEADQVIVIPLQIRHGLIRVV